MSAITREMMDIKTHRMMVDGMNILGSNISMNIGDTIGKLTKEVPYYLKCFFCGDTANEDELQVTKGRCPTCNNKRFKDVDEEDNV